jgi:6-phosphogluconolactonase
VPSPAPEIRVVEDEDALARAAAEEFVAVATGAVRGRSAVSVALSGGSTPRRLYALLASPSYRERIPWSGIHFFFGDERCVPPDDPQSNFRMASEAMLSHVSVPPANIHRIPAEDPDPDRAAARYEEDLRGHFGLSGDAVPRFDLALLGLGPDGHTASLFPGTKALHETRRLAVSNWVGKFAAWRITLTVPVFNTAGSVLFLVRGEDKATALKSVLEGPTEPEQLPAQLIRPAGGSLLWLVDRDAAALLSPSLTASG